jgi:hypothetical protein
MYKLLYYLLKPACQIDIKIILLVIVVTIYKNKFFDNRLKKKIIKNH